MGQEPTASVDPETGALRIDLSTFLGDGGLRSALHSGLPVRVEVRIELWRDGFFDQQEAGEEWRASVVHDPVTRSYLVSAGDQEPQAAASLRAAGVLLDAAFEPTTTPARRARYYYVAQVELETLSLSDLRELSRWLKGDLTAAVQGEEGPQSALSRGLRRVVVRTLGLPARRERLRTPSFDWRPGVGMAPGGPGDAPEEAAATTEAHVPVPLPDDRYGPEREPGDPAVTAPPAGSHHSGIPDRADSDQAGFPCMYRFGERPAHSPGGAGPRRPAGGGR